MNVIIHIESDIEYRNKICKHLKRESFLVKECSTIAEALRILEERDCFCIIMDVNSGEIPWYEGLAHLRNLYHDLSIILTAAENTKEIESKARIEGVTYYHVKTFQEDEIINAVKEIFTMKLRERENVYKKTAQKKILVIDDDYDFQEAIRIILTKANYGVVQAFNKDEGEKKVKSESPDLIILDIMMESITAGFQFLYEVIGTKEQRKTQIPVLSITSISQRSGFKFSPSIDRNLFPADDYLAKPVEPEKLLERVAILIKNKS